jgi:hypothetical protein
MTDQELKEYEQELLAQWTPRIALEIQIDRLNSQRAELLEIYNQLKSPADSNSLRLSYSIKSLKYKLESIEDDLDDLIQDSRNS